MNFRKIPSGIKCSALIACAASGFFLTNMNTPKSQSTLEFNFGGLEAKAFNPLDLIFRAARNSPCSVLARVHLLGGVTCTVANPWGPLVSEANNKPVFKVYAWEVKWEKAEDDCKRLFSRRERPTNLIWSKDNSGKKLCIGRFD